jgi:hypothetical protein
VELRTAIASGKRRTNLQNPQEDPRAGLHEESKRDAQRVETETVHVLLVTTRHHRQLLGKVLVIQLAKKFPVIYVIGRLVTVFI